MFAEFCCVFQTLASACGKFAPFEIKAHMSLAPLTRVQCEDAVLEELDHYLAQPDSTLNGLKDWTKHKPRTSGPTRPSHSAVRYSHFEPLLTCLSTHVNLQNLSWCFCSDVGGLFFVWFVFSFVFFVIRDCVVITESQKADGAPDRHRYGRMKLLQFHDNYRPAYWGTWCKKSTHISPRCPLRLDKVKAQERVNQMLHLSHFTVIVAAVLCLWFLCK